MFDGQQLRLGREEAYKSTYKLRFDQLEDEFGDSYEIHTPDKDGFDHLYVEIVNVKTNPKTRVQFSFTGVELLSKEFINSIHSCLQSNTSKDLGEV
jgi:hypothetical protein